MDGIYIVKRKSKRNAIKLYKIKQNIYKLIYSFFENIKFTNKKLRFQNNKESHELYINILFKSNL